MTLLPTVSVLHIPPVLSLFYVLYKQKVSKTYATNEKVDSKRSTVLR